MSEFDTGWRADMTTTAWFVMAALWVAIVYYAQSKLDENL